MSEVEPGVWQRVRIEFEFESRNFLKHKHRVNKCDVIVCLKHNWKDCPLDVVELGMMILDRVKLDARSPESRDIAVIAEIGKIKTLPLINADHADQEKSW